MTLSLHLCKMSLSGFYHLWKKTHSLTSGGLLLLLLLVQSLGSLISQILVLQGMFSSFLLGFNLPMSFSQLHLTFRVTIGCRGLSRLQGVVFDLLHLPNILICSFSHQWLWPVFLTCCLMIADVCMRSCRFCRGNPHHLVCACSWLPVHRLTHPLCLAWSCCRQLAHPPTAGTHLHSQLCLTFDWSCTA